MSDIDVLRDRIHYLSQEVQKYPRVNPDDQTQTGWGQFVDAPAHSNQIGPYGTCAALLLQSLTHADAPIPETVVTQLEGFWNEPKPENKLITQNVRLAFLVLALAHLQHPKLKELRDKAIATLKSRQQSDGGWPDAVSEGAVHPLSRTDSTAWVVLALHRVDSADANAAKGAEFIQSQVAEGQGTPAISPIAVAAALTVLPVDKHSKKLKRKGISYLKTSDVDLEEHISFFDFMDERNGKPRMARDYLCFPAFYPLSLLASGLTGTKNPITAFRIASYRARLIERLLHIVPANSLYRLPGAQFSATVDQALIALAYERLLAARTYFDPFTAKIRPLVEWISDSIVVRVVLPLLVLTVAIATLADPVSVPQAIGNVTGIDTTELVNWSRSNAATVRVAVALFVAIVPNMPRSVWVYFKRKLGL